MRFSTGDRVKFLNETGGGTVTRIISEKSVMVMTRDGFEIPVAAGELILHKKGQGYGSSDDADTRISDRKARDVPDDLHESYYDDTEPDDISLRNEPDVPDARLSDISAAPDAGFPGQSSETSYQGSHEEEEGAQRAPERNILFAFVETEVPGQLDAWLINDSSFTVLYSLLIKQDELYRHLKAGMIDADTKIFIKNFTREQINEFVSLRIEAIFFRKGIFDPVSPSRREFDIDPAEIYGTGFFSGNEFFEEKAGIIPVISDPFDRETKKITDQDIHGISVKDKPIFPEIKKDKKTDPNVEEVDLHIEELVDDTSGLSGREALDIQMARFTTAIEGAIRGKTKRIVFIHGVGNGKLKFEIRKTLDRKYTRLKYQDASFREYGYGATMVILRK